MRVRISLAAALTLRIETGQFYRAIASPCINLIVDYPEGCSANCAYCGMARGRQRGGAGGTFIRVSWPCVDFDMVLERVSRSGSKVGRICISMVRHPRALADTLALCRAAAKRLDIPVSALVDASGVDVDGLRALRRAGAERIGIGLDAASRQVFERHRGLAVKGPHRWQAHWAAASLAKKIFGVGRVNCHIIAGLGESDFDIARTAKALSSMGVESYLFSFYPEIGSALEGRRRPSLKRYRRLKLMKYLLVKGLARLDEFEFDRRGGLRRVGIPFNSVEGAILSGEPLLTDGCPDRAGALCCNRPFGGYRPGEKFREFPFGPNRSEVLSALDEMKAYELFKVGPRYKGNFKKEEKPAGLMG